MAMVWLLLGFGLLALGAELLVRGSSRLAAMFGISPLVIGLTVVAFGTSTPELAVSLKAAYAGQPDIAVGNCIGSSIFNVLLILGLCAAIAPLVVAQQLVWIDVPIMIGAHLLLGALAWDGLIGRWDGLLLFGGILAYVWFAIRMGKQENAAVAAEYDAAYGEVAPARLAAQLFRQLGLVLAGLVACVLGARWLVEAATALARAWGVGELVIGLTIVAAGTSMPEVATSVVATLRGQRDIAIGNVIGSNIFNVLCILGLTGLAAPAGVPIAPGVLGIDLPVAIAVCIACLPIFFSGHRINRWEGLLFLGYYAAYTGYLVMSAQAHQALPMFSQAMVWFVLPLTVVTLVVVFYRAVRTQRPISSF